MRHRSSAFGLVLALCLLWAVPVQATIALVANTAAQSSDTNNVTTSAIDTTGATLLVVAVTPNASAATLTDSKSNTWVLVISENDAFSYVKLYYCKNPTVGSGHTFTATGAASYESVYAAAFSGTDTTANYDQATSGTATTSTTVQPGSVTPTTNNQLVVTAMISQWLGSEVFSINSGFTITDQLAGVNGYPGAMAYKIQTTAGAENPTWTENQLSASLAAVISTFKAGSAGATPVRHRANAY